jgi:flagellar basal-body rod modification protein FlgD
MSVQAISTLGQTDTSLYTTTSNSTMGKEDFLQLLITQIQQQDPLDPQDPSEFVSQLTQFSNLEQLMTVNDAIEGLQVLQASGNNAQAANLIGKNVMYEGGQVNVTGGAAGSLYMSAATAAQNATITITNSDGDVVRTLKVNGLESGIQSIAWDGLDNSGNAVADGNYTFTVSATDTSGDAVTVTPLTMGYVSGISFEDGITYLNIGDEKVSLSDIVSVRQA